MSKVRKKIWVTFQKEGIHLYPAAATDPKLKTGGWDDVSFLGVEHRHIFHFRVSMEVFHDDRDVEFIQFKRWLERLYSEGTLVLNHKSCEMISDDLYAAIIAQYPNREIEIEVSEDGENGSYAVYPVINGTIKMIDHDVTDVTGGVVAHGCNCQGVMGSGVAKAIRSKWPQAYEEYAGLVLQHDFDRRSLLGTVQFVNVEPTVVVANLFTQEYYGNDGRVYASIDAVRSALEATFAYCQSTHNTLYMPLIGCGLGGLNWVDDVFPIVVELHDKYRINVVVCTQ